MNKRGVSHIEILFAFIIFIGFLVFAMYFFNPFNTDRVLDSTLYYAYDELVANVSVTLESYSVVFNVSTPSNVSFALDSTLANARAVNSNNARIPTHYTGSNVQVSRGNDRFVQVRFSSAFNATPAIPNVVALTPANFTVSSSEMLEVVNEQAVILLNASYVTNYYALKQAFNLPGRTDFAFALRFEDGREIRTSIPIPSNLEVFTERKQVQVVRTDGTLTFGHLEVKVW